MRWLSTSNVLSRFVNLLEPKVTFLQEKKRSYPQLENDEWMQDLMFVTDIMNHLQILNLALRRKKIVSDLTQTMFSYQNKTRVFQRNILSRNFSHFPNFRRRVNTFADIEIKDHKLEEYKNILQELLDNFLARFDEQRKLKSCFAFLEPLVTKSSAVEMELMELQEDLGLKMIHKYQSTMEF
ncbi:general transcription factor II-I repeat domain-containing protein 2-like [Octopus bimaculoides]|uniref:general transcription factor II-I repeat domain-containing protein 2-like n=1 Tax=Octopus bimaculoides TaxID=37653 RepID=UPI00071E3E62|nr:general transcription factor II-I repeat domain-containing protein 2-like [Octopus bimaculoides]|eukprot:XP_014781660.1 PREDICTED: general transcription factor II-I repeat domain-containing protein 2-like [Octopus bimaculoides]